MQNETKPDTFGAIQIETIHGCNLNCPTCPNSVIPKNRELMSWEDYKMVLGQLKDIGYRGRISPYLQNEPTIDPRIKDILRYTREQFPDNRIFLGSNGIELDENSLLDLFDAGMSDILITCYNEATWNKFARLQGEKIRLLDAYSQDRELIFYNRGGNINVGETGVVHETCDKGIKQAFVNYLGQLILCCADYKYEVVFGDLHEIKIMDAFNCDIAKQYRAKLRNRDRSGLKLCETCNVNRPQQRFKRHFAKNHETPPQN